MRSSKQRDPFRVVAILSAYNESDIISPVIGHLVGNGVQVYLIDNRSTDDTVEKARPWLGRGLLRIEEFPEEPPPGQEPPPFDWGAILKRKEDLAKELKADWFIHHDADEIREAPWPGMSLKEAIHWVDRLGYNCVDFRVLNFPPVDSDFKPGMDPAAYFTRWEEPVVHDRVQLKCWKARAGSVSLVASGGHEVRFPNRRVFPIQFLLRHYPIRSPEHGRRKVFEDRKKRFLQEERAKGWHIQYDRIEDESHSFLGNPLQLNPFDADQVRLDLMLRNQETREAESSLNLREHELAGLREQYGVLGQEVAQLRGIRTELERHASGLDADRRRLTDHLIERERQVAGLEAIRGELERHTARLEEHRNQLARRVEEIENLLVERERHIANLEGIRGELKRHALGLEADRRRLTGHLTERERHIANLENVRAELERHADGLEKDRGNLQRHIAHLERVRSEEERRAAELQREKATLLDRVAETEQEKATLREDLRAIQSSTTWRWSAPLRFLLDGLKKLMR